MLQALLDALPLLVGAAVVVVIVAVAVLVARAPSPTPRTESENYYEDPNKPGSKLTYAFSCAGLTSRNCIPAMIFA